MHVQIQLNLAPMDSKGPTNFIGYQWNSVLANIGKRLNESRNNFCYKQNSIKSGSVDAGFNCAPLAAMCHTWL